MSFNLRRLIKKHPTVVLYFIVAGCNSLFIMMPGCVIKNSTHQATFTVIGAQGLAAGQFVQPRAIASSSDGKLFVADKTGRIQKFDSAGKFESSWEMPDNDSNRGKPSGICVDHQQRVLVADTHQSRVIVFDQDGKELFRFGERGQGDGQFMLPTDVVVDHDGNIYVSEYGGNDRISKFDFNGQFLFSFGDIGDGSASLQRPSGLAIDKSNNLWVADTSNHRICCFNSQGELIKTIGDLGTGTGKIRYPRDLVFLNDGIVAIIEEGNNRISYFDVQGHFLTACGCAGHGMGEFDSPVSIAVQKNLIYVADTKNHRVQFGNWSDMISMQTFHTGLVKTDSDFPAPLETMP